MDLFKSVSQIQWLPRFLCSVYLEFWVTHLEYSSATCSHRLGPIDLLNTIPSFVMSFVVYYVYKKTQNDYTVIGTCIAYSLVLGTTVGWMLSPIHTLPLLFSIAYVAVGNLVATVLIGWPLFKLLKATGLFPMVPKSKGNKKFSLKTIKR